MSDPEPKFKLKAELDPTIDFVAGTVAGMAGLVIGFPFDTVKVRFQNPEISHRYRSTWGALMTIVREERFTGLYKGISSPLATAALLNGLVFASYGYFMRMQQQHEDHVPSLWQIALAGAGSGIVSSIVTTPTELIKIRQQSLLTVTSARAVALQIFSEAGVRGLYRGITATALRDCGYGAYFAAYEATCRYFVPPRPSNDHDEVSILSQVESEMNTLSWPALLLAGGIAGVAGWLFTFPFDVVKTRVQGSLPGEYYHATSSVLEPRSLTTPLRPSTPQALLRTGKPPRTPNPYRTTLSTIRNSYRAEGIRVFYRGLAPTLIRAIPVNMATFAAFEAIVHSLS